MQTVITTHSPHIVASHPFENIRYMSARKDENSFFNIDIKNFHQDLSQKYESEPDEFKFLQQYLSIESAELFFADKAIFIEGISEAILLQHFISQFDKVKLDEERAAIAENPELKPSYIPLAAQNITVVQAGANAAAFRHFLEFLQIPSLVITDIDTSKPKQTSKGTRYVKCAVNDVDCCKTSNGTIMYYLHAPKFENGDQTYATWFENAKKHALDSISHYINISYQAEENGYFARSFEDAFINVNFDLIKSNIDAIHGLKNNDAFEDSPSNLYEFTQTVIEEKSDFASSLLFLAHAKDINWKAPSYIREGFEWLQKL